MTLTLIDKQNQETTIDLNPQAIILFGEGRPDTPNAGRTFFEIHNRDNWIWVKESVEEIKKALVEHHVERINKI